MHIPDLMLVTSNKRLKWNLLSCPNSFFAVVIVVVILILYAFYADASFKESVDEIAYGTSCIVTTISVVVIPLTTYKMAVLTFKVCKTLIKLRSSQKSESLKWCVSMTLCPLRHQNFEPGAMNQNILSNEQWPKN